jgi:restriction system protein
VSVPTYDQLIFPLLRLLAEARGPLKSREVYDLLAKAIGLQEADRVEMLPSGRQAVFHNRVGWANDRLKRAGLTEGVSRGHWQTTAAGKAYLKVSRDTQTEPPSGHPSGAT